MTHNDLKEGMRVQLTPILTISNKARFGTIMDNMKGITRMVKIEDKNGYYPDIGSVYVSEIQFVLYPDDMPQELEVSEAHQKKLDLLEKIHWG